MLTYNQLIERQVSKFGHRDSNDRVDKDLASHGFKRVPASNDPADAGTHTRWALQRMKGKSGPKGKAGQAKGVNKGKSNLDHAAPGSKRINTVKREGDNRPTHLGKGSTGKKGEIDKVGRKSNVLAMKQHWQDNNVPSPEKREEMKAGIGKPKKKTHDNLQSPSSRPSNEDRKEMKRKALRKEHTEWWLDAFRFNEATEEQLALQKQRQADRVAKGGKGSEGSGGTHFHQGQAEKNRRIKQGKAPNLNTTSTTGQPKKEVPRGVSPSEASRATSNVKSTQVTAGLGNRTGQTGTTREATGRQKGGDLAKRPVTGTSPGAGALVRGGQKTDRQANPYRQANKEATPKPAEPVKPEKPKPDNRRRNRTFRKYAGKAAGAVGSAFTRQEPEAVTTGGDTGNISGGSEYISRTKRG